MRGGIGLIPEQLQSSQYRNSELTLPFTDVDTEVEGGGGTRLGGGGLGRGADGTEQVTQAVLPQDPLGGES